MVGGFANRQAYLRYTRSEDDSEREKERETKEEERMKGHLYNTSRGEVSPTLPHGTSSHSGRIEAIPAVTGPARTPTPGPNPGLRGKFSECKNSALVIVTWNIQAYFVYKITSLSSEYDEQFSVADMMDANMTVQTQRLALLRSGLRNHVVIGSAIIFGPGLSYRYQPALLVNKFSIS